jgi:Glycosyl transferase family 11.
MGGLGNQLFQYAMASAVAQRAKLPLYLDLSWLYDHEKKIGVEKLYGLHVFSFQELFANEDIIQCFLPRNTLLKTLTRGVNRLLPCSRRKLIEERGMRWNPDIMKIRKPVYFYTGYWQSEKYFFDLAPHIRKQLTFRKEIQEDIIQNRSITDLIVNTNAVGLHVRRGDYVNDPKMRSIFVAFTMQYYLEAAQYIVQKVKNPVFFVFSDDVSWVKENLHMPYDVYYVDDSVQMNQECGPKSKGYEDMFLMSLCKHNIIANSSFSWWGAWLNQNPDKIVIAPQKWCNQGFDYTDIVPEDWLRM